MLRAAVNDPKVIIVAANERQVEILERSYHKLISEQPWYKRLWWKIIKRRSPVFVSIGNARKLTDGMMEPVMCDNLTLIQSFKR